MKGLKYYTWSDYVRRFAWAIATPFFAFSPRWLAGWRNWILRSFGAQIGQRTLIFPSVKIAQPWKLSVGADTVIAWQVVIYNLGYMRIGDRVVISQHAHLCGGTHDYEAPDFSLIKSDIAVGDDVWIAADAFVGPGCVIGRGAVVGARAVVTGRVNEQTVMAGNPARAIATRNLRRQL